MSRVTATMSALIALVLTCTTAMTREKIGPSETPPRKEVEPQLWLLKRHGLRIDLPDGPGWQVVTNNVEYTYLAVNRKSHRAVEVSVQVTHHKTVNDTFIRETERLERKRFGAKAKFKSKKKLEISGAPAYQYAVMSTRAGVTIRSMTRIILANTREYFICVANLGGDGQIDEEFMKFINSASLLGTGKSWEQDFLSPGDDPSEYRYQPTRKDLEFLEKLKKDVEGKSRED